jgi:hypothetical protein
MPDVQHIAVKPLSGISSDQGRDARARAWSYVFECFALRTKNKAAPASGPDDAKESKNAMRRKEAEMP